MTTTGSGDVSGGGDINRSLELLWLGKEPARRGPKRGLTLERIVSAAVQIADSDGLAALSMRRVAAELDVGTMSLYRYVPGKGELLDLMLDHVNPPREQLDAHRGKHWRSHMEHVARGSWRLYWEHPWLLQVNQARPLLGPNGMASFDFVLAGLDSVGLTGREKIALILAVDHYVTGTARTYILRRSASEESGISDEEFWAAQEPVLSRAIERGDYPALAGLDEEDFDIDAEEAFEFGLSPLLDGLEAFIAAQRDG